MKVYAALALEYRPRFERGDGFYSRVGGLIITLSGVAVAVAVESASITLSRGR